MCGIAGWVSYDGDLKSQRDVITTMTKTMARRGPDAGGVWIDRHVGLGHRRLAVIDLAGGVQPMQAEELGQPTVSLIYTGEVYNFVELRDELKQLGHRFKTRSDTEVVLRGYLEWGDKVAEHLNGMFAFAIWDVRTEELFLIRDRMGVKPLFYYPTTDGVLFGSEAKAILAHPSVRPRVNKEGFRELLEDIVQRQIVADVPLCSLLSGGLDSSAVTAMADRAIAVQQRGRIRSFCVDFASHGTAFVAGDFHKSSDTPFVRDFVAHVGCDHTEVVLDSRELADRDLSRAVIHSADFPLGTSRET